MTLARLGMQGIGRGSPRARGIVTESGLEVPSRGATGIDRVLGVVEVVVVVVVVGFKGCKATSGGAKIGAVRLMPARGMRTSRKSASA